MKSTNSSKCVGIVGLGLIGGSLGLDMQSMGWEVHGLVHRSSTALRAKERGLAQVISKDPKILSDCEIVILALPLEKLLKPSDELINSLPQNAVITDVGSVKAPILKLWNSLHKKFIPSHPMAGTIEAGVEAGQHNLFKNHPWVVTPDKNTDAIALDTIKNLALSVNSKWIVTDAEVHDEAVALISHLPVLISSALIKTVGEERNQSVLQLAKFISSSGFADTSRVGGGNPELGTAMMSNNTSSIIKALGSYRWRLEQLEETIIAKNWEKLYQDLNQTKKIRPEFLEKES